MPDLSEYKQRMDSLFYDLKIAEKSMNDWMEQFNPDPKLPTTEEKVAYFKEQKAKVVFYQQCRPHRVDVFTAERHSCRR